MFKRSLAILLLFALLVSNFQRYVVYAGFEMNHDYIAKNLCINRNRPWMHCNGHCYFMRKLKQAEENEKKQAARDDLSRLEVSFFQDNIAFKFLSIKIEEPVIDHYDNYRCSYKNRYTSPLFKPPTAIA